MISMAAYGAVTATTGIGGMAAVERMQGWGRQLGLTPMRDASYVPMKALLALVVAAIPIALIYLLGCLTGAEGTAGAWVLSALIVLARRRSLRAVRAGRRARLPDRGGGQRRERAPGDPGVPRQHLLPALRHPARPIAKFTPLYGYVALARYPLTEGYLEYGGPRPAVDGRR